MSVTTHCCKETKPIETGHSGGFSRYLILRISPKAANHPLPGIP